MKHVITFLFVVFLVLIGIIYVSAHMHVRAQEPLLLPVTVEGDLEADEYFITLMKAFGTDREMPSLLIKIKDGQQKVIEESDECQFWAYKPVFDSEAWIELCGGGVDNTYVLYNGEKYKSIDNINPIDFHDFHIDKDGNVYTFIYNRGKQGQPFGFVVQKQSPNRQLLFEFDSSDHMSPDEAYLPWARKSDWAHVNSIDVSYPYIMLSLRHTNSVVTINEETGKIAWQLGGVKNSFDPSRRTVFHMPCMQHTARFHLGQPDVITVFDNGYLCRPYSRGVTYKLNLQTMVATQTHEIAPRQAMFAAAGSYDRKGNSHLLSWGFSRSRGTIFASEVTDDVRTDFIADTDYFNYQIYRRFIQKNAEMYLPVIHLQ